MSAPIFARDEVARLSDLRRYKILDTDPEQGFDDLTLLASHICQSPIALITLIDAERQWFKSRVGVSIIETPRELSFCARAIEQSDLFIVPDATKDERFKTHPFVVSEPKIRFYAGVPFRSASGQPLGTLCVIDRKARQLTPEQRQRLKTLAQMAMLLLEVRKSELDTRGGAAAP